MKEQELATHFVDFFSDHDVYQEVPGSGIIDIIAVKRPIVTAIEVKMCLSMDVIEQAQKNTQYAHYSYAAVPSLKRGYFGFASRVCKDYGIGILTWNGKQVTEVSPPRLNRTIHKLKLADWMKESFAGCQSGRMTAFKATVREIVRKLEWYKGTHPIKATFAEINHHYSSVTSAQSSICSLIRSGDITEFTYDKGHFILNKKDPGNQPGSQP